jgi:hypothetical protein
MSAEAHARLAQDKHIALLVRHDPLGSEWLNEIDNKIELIEAKICS